jgi:hypothetical protein
MCDLLAAPAHSRSRDLKKHRSAARAPRRQSFCNPKNFPERTASARVDTACVA